MACNKVWSREFVMEKTEWCWVRDEFFPHMGRVILEQEKGMLPNAQTEASLIIQIRELSAQVTLLPTNNRLMRKFKSKPEELYAQLEEKRDSRNRLLEQIAKLKKQTVMYGKDDDAVDGGSKDKGVADNYIFKCPYGACRGFVSTSYVCGTCKGEVCKHCHVPVSQEAAKHKCKKEDKQTAAMVVKETKPCPKCKTLIFKVSGCNQMFCTQCHTAFDWESGLVEDGIIHNPHYYEMLSANPDMRMHNIDALACGGIPPPYTYQSYVHRMTHDYSQGRALLEIYRVGSHVRQAVMPAYEVNRVRDNFDLRVAYLLNEFDEVAWASKLMNREKKRMKMRAVRELLQMIATVLEDFVRRVCFENTTADSILAQYAKLKLYYEDALQKIANVHGGKIPQVLHIFEGAIGR